MYNTNLTIATEAKSSEISLVVFVLYQLLNLRIKDWEIIITNVKL